MISDIINKTISKYQMLHKNSHVVVGVSGGADSMCLLHFLHSNREKFQISVTAAHLNHMIRGNEADRDEQFVNDWCREQNIDFIAEKADVPLLARDKKIGEEECGRLFRYDFFNRLAGTTGLIATAHTASDNAETVLFNITRGCGINGIGGIQPVRANIIRPLIELTRSQIEDYCRENNVPYITDSTNNDDVYSRNRIRHKIIPILKDINSCFETNVSSLSESARQDNEFLNNLADEQLKLCSVPGGYSAEKLASLPIPILKRAIIKLVDNYGICIDRTKLNISIDLLDFDGAVDIDKNFSIRVKNGIFNIAKKGKSSNDNNENWQYNINNTFVFDKNNKKYSLIFENSDENIKNFKFNKLLFNNAVDCAIITGNTLIRNRRDGDKFSQAGRGCTKSLKKLFNELKIPADKRDLIAVIANDSEVLWIEGIGVSEKAKITNNTKNVAVIKMEES